MVISNFGRALSITKRIAGRLPQPAPVLELDVTDEEHLAGSARRGSASTSRGWTVWCTRSRFGNPETMLGGKFLTAPWEDVATGACTCRRTPWPRSRGLPADDAAGGAVVGMTFDATVAWPAYDWMGVAKAGAGVDAPATSPATSGRRASGSTSSPPAR